jgi:hypothetical protein
MKLKNIAKSVIAASALTIASFGANANLIGTAVLDIENFNISAVNGDLNLISSQWTTTNTANYLGLAGPTSEVTDTTNSLGSVIINLPNQCAGPDCTQIGEDNYAHNLLSLGDDLDFVSSDSKVSFDFPSFTTNAQSRADVSLSKTNSDNLSRGESGITNTVTGVLEFDLATMGDVDFSYDFVAELVAAVSPDWATNLHDAFVEASYSLTVSITELANPTNIIDMGDLNTGLTLSSTGAFNFDLEPSGSKSQTLVDLNAGAYQIGVTHSTYVSAKHVPEPTTLAIFGLGLLGLAGASRRRNS